MSYVAVVVGARHCPVMKRTHAGRRQLTDTEERRLPKWPLRLVLSLVIVLDVFFVVMLSLEGIADNILMLVNSVGLLVCSVLVWRGVRWSRWLLAAFLVWRVAGIGFAVVFRMGTGDHRIPGSLTLIVLYVVIGLVIASPLGRSRGHESA